MSDKRIVHSEDQPWEERSHGDFFHVRCRRLGQAAGSHALGCNMFELSPGKTAMPFHHHLASEEAVFVVAGAGTLRLGDGHHAVRSGDYIAFPAGGEPHQLTNTGADPLRYLVVSTKPVADVVVYPDSDKVGAIATEGKDAWVRFFPGDSQVDYWHGEPGATTSRDGDANATRRPSDDGDTSDEGDDDDDDLEQRIDDEIAALKHKLGLSGKRGGRGGRGPKRGSAARKVVDAAIDEIERLKRELDG